MKAKQTSDHNTAHKNERTPSTPDRRAKPKAKTGPSLKQLEPVPPLPTGEKASGSQDNPESTSESKGKAGRPSNTQGPPPVRKDKNKNKENPKPTPKPNPDHDAEKDDNRTRTHWRKTKRGYLVDQLSKHGWRWPKTPDGKM